MAVYFTDCYKDCMLNSMQLSVRFKIIVGSIIYPNSLTARKNILIQVVALLPSETLYHIRFIQ